MNLYCEIDIHSAAIIHTLIAKTIPSFRPDNTICTEVLFLLVFFHGSCCSGSIGAIGGV